MEQVRAITGTTYPAANELVHNLVTHGILLESTGQKRRRRFRYADYFGLFEEPEPALPEAGL